MDFKLTADQEALRARARHLADTVFRDRAARWDAAEEYPWDNVKDLVRAGFMGLSIPKKHGGAGASILDVLLVVEEIARACGMPSWSRSWRGRARPPRDRGQKRRYFRGCSRAKTAIAIT
jgi:alkylation response protein AidB-like acyl-CoA dehydrogenase